MTTPILILTILSSLLLVANAFLLFWRFLRSRIFRIRLSKKREEKHEKNKQPEPFSATDELPEEILLAIISAAVASIELPKRNTRFRVVSFRELD